MLKRKSENRCHECVCQSLRCWYPTLSGSFDFFPRSLAIKEFFSKPKYNHILKPEDCLSEPCTILQLDMRTVQIADLEVRDESSLSHYVGDAHTPELAVQINEFMNFAFDFSSLFSLRSDFVFYIFILFSL